MCKKLKLYSYINVDMLGLDISLICKYGWLKSKETNLLLLLFTPPNLLCHWARQKGYIWWKKHEKYVFVFLSHETYSSIKNIIVQFFQQNYFSIL